MAGQISFMPDVADHIAVSRGAWARSIRQRRFVVRLVVMSLAAALAGGIFGWLDGLPGEALIVAACSVGGLLLALFVMCGLTWLLIPRRTSRLFRQQKTLNEETGVSWDEHGMRYRSAKGYSELAWSDFHDWLERPCVFLFVLNDRMFHFVPKRALTAEQGDDLRRCATTHFRR